MLAAIKVRKLGVNNFEQFLGVAEEVVKLCTYPTCPRHISRLAHGVQERFRGLVGVNDTHGALPTFRDIL